MNFIKIKLFLICISFFLIKSNAFGQSFINAYTTEKKFQVVNFIDHDQYDGYIKEEDKYLDFGLEYNKVLNEIRVTDYTNRKFAVYKNISSSASTEYYEQYNSIDPQSGEKNIIFFNKNTVRIKYKDKYTGLNKTVVLTHNKRKLRYLYASNGGINAYYDDGSIVGCARCDYIQSNLISMHYGEPDGTYVVQPDGTLLVNGSSREYPKYESSSFDGWSVIDYVWYRKPSNQ